jgi:predicted MFS family arabinose efflux permease
MATKDDRTLGLTMAAAGVGIMGAAVVFGLTMDGGGIDWVGIVTAAAGALMAITGLFTALRRPLHATPRGDRPARPRRTRRAR